MNGGGWFERERERERAEEREEKEKSKKRERERVCVWANKKIFFIFIIWSVPFYW